MGEGFDIISFFANFQGVGKHAANRQILQGSQLIYGFY
jgi:hypothetical protein